ncbi:Lrp/AsnC family transcriptional regulator [Streptomyces sp. 110]|uniref:Lrp/AsnC family transcriptional regulator n=1 Tax=Streptomyces endocoffeicus TaxID=2898945 RepID=A0ABS1PHR1_9ACTN|nr:Lrp/AsnC family transcriptional regulator [Streptomyces endocoffeicus]MBL1111326.1 Lrp/AsnC family transcriptional regulator [Streptomyces endocoffeicus]
MQKVRHDLDATDRRITAVLMASPRASWRRVAEVLGVSERTVVRRGAPLFHDRTLRATAVRNPALFPHLIPMVLRIRCRPNRIATIAATLSRRPDTIWVDILGGGDEICVVLFLNGREARDKLLLRDLPATAAVQSWTSYDLLKVFPGGFAWSAGLLTPEESGQLWPSARPPSETCSPLPDDEVLIDALVEDSRMTYGELAQRTGRTPRAVRRRLDTLVEAYVVRLATEVELSLLGVRAEALLWITAGPGALEETGRILSRHPQVRFTSATTGSSNLLVAVAATDPGALYTFLTGTVGALPDVSGLEVTPILAGVKRTGLVRPASISV